MPDYSIVVYCMMVIYCNAFSMFFHILLQLKYCFGNMQFSPAHSSVIFSGLRQNIQLPVYYMFIHLSDHEGNPLVESPSNKVVLRLSDSNGNRLRVQQDLLDRQDGTLIARFRLWASCSMMNVAVTDEKGVDFQNSPIQLINVNTDTCHCPVPSVG